MKVTYHPSERVGKVAKKVPPCFSLPNLIIGLISLLIDHICHVKHVYRIHHVIGVLIPKNARLQILRDKAPRARTPLTFVRLHPSFQFLSFCDYTFVEDE